MLLLLKGNLLPLKFLDSECFKQAALAKDILSKLYEIRPFRISVCKHYFDNISNWSSMPFIDFINRLIDFGLYVLVELI